MALGEGGGALSLALAVHGTAALWIHLLPHAPQLAIRLLTARWREGRPSGDEAPG